MSSRRWRSDAARGSLTCQTTCCFFSPCRSPRKSSGRIGWRSHLPLPANGARGQCRGVMRDILKLSFTPQLRGVPSMDFAIAIEDLTMEGSASGDDNTIVFALEPIEPGADGGAAATDRDCSARRPAHRQRGSAWTCRLTPTDASWSPQEGPVFPCSRQRDLALAHDPCGCRRHEARPWRRCERRNHRSGHQPRSCSGQPLSSGEVQPADGSSTRYGRGGPPAGPPKLVLAGPLGSTGMRPGWRKRCFRWHRMQTSSTFRFCPATSVNLQTLRELGPPGSTAMLQSLIPWLRQVPRYSGPWILCNAWAVFDLSH